MSLPATGRAAGYGFDVLMPPGPYAEQLKAADLTGAHGGWMRVRGVVEPAMAGHSRGNEVRTVESDREGLRALRVRGVKTTVFLRWEPSSWPGGVRAGGGHRMPLDLREAYERGRRLGAAYGDLVDVWEVDNEPDIGYGPDNPEVYAAFLKAVYLGIHAGRGDAPAGVKATALNLQAGSGWRARKLGAAVAPDDMTGPAWVRARVVMAPLALPPGPYLERLWANGLASYTDGFNFHYYGYAKDFTGVYRQFEDAVRELSERPTSNVERLERPTSNVQHSTFNFEGSEREGAAGSTKRLPVFITEYGYGLLDEEARNSVEGRVRQWRWFADVIAQVRALRPEAPMAFLWTPYFESGLNEFGLMMQTAPRFDAGGERGGGAETDRKVEATKPGMVLRAGDLGSSQAEPWMQRIGKPVGTDFASPALAQLWDFAERNPYRPRDWHVQAVSPSSVVIDLIAGEGMNQVKVSGGYRMLGTERAGMRSGQARLVIYNFSKKAVRGRLSFDEPSPVLEGATSVMTLAAGERRELAIKLAVDGGTWTERTLAVRFVPESGGAKESSVFKTALLPSSAGMTTVPVEVFAPVDNQAAVARQLARVPVEEEPRLYAQGRWLATDGVRVEERGDGVWRFHIDYLSEGSLRPAAVELPLPAGFVFDPDTLLTCEYRRVDAATQGERPRIGADGKPLAAARLTPLAGTIGDGMGLYVRTMNGNLYSTGGRIRLTSEWRYYAGRAQDFTMGFFGRAELPWRFSANTPASVFFFLRPATLPAVFEVRNARIVRLE